MGDDQPMGYKAKLATLPEGAFYDCRDNEELSHDDPIDAVMELVDLHYDPAFTAEATIRKIGDVCVKAYARNTISDAWFSRATDYAIETVSESFDEEYGDPNDYSDCASDVSKQKGEIEAALRRVFANVTVWRCHVIGKVHLTPDDVISLVRDHEPAWLEREAPVAGDAGVEQ